MRRSSGLLAGLVLAALASPVVAVGPFDDDAGTGGDAGDLLTTATPLSPGVYHGTLRAPHDFQDVYVFEGRQGEVLDLEVEDAFLTVGRFNPVVPFQPRPYFFVNPPNAARFVLPMDGPWYLAFSALGTKGLAQEEPYRFRFALGPGVTAVAAASPLGWQAVEAAWSEPTLVDLYARVDLAAGAGASPTALLGVELYDAEGALSAYLYNHYAWGGAGDKVKVASLAELDVPEPVLFAEASDGLAYLKFQFQAPPGALRLVAYHTVEGASFLTLHLDVPGVHATADGDGVLRRDLSDFDGGLEAHTPLGGVSDGDTWSAPLGDRTVAYFNALGPGGWVEDPQGQRTEVEGVHFLIAPAEGTWWFHVEGKVLSTVLGPFFRQPMPDEVSLDGATFPRLGLAP